MKLPTAPRPPKTDNPTCLLLYGPPKCGKTSAIAALTGCQIAELEPHGGDFVEGLFTDSEDLKDLKALDKWMLLCKEAGVKFGAVDTFTSLEALCEKWVTKEYKASNVGKNFDGKSVCDLPKGAGYGLLRSCVKETILTLMGSFPYFILTGHVRDKFVEKRGEVIAREAFDATGLVASIVLGLVDAAGLMSRDKDGKLWVDFRTVSEESPGKGTRVQRLAGQKLLLCEGPGQPMLWGRIYTGEGLPE